MNIRPSSSMIPATTSPSGTGSGQLPDSDASRSLDVSLTQAAEESTPCPATSISTRSVTPCNVVIETIELADIELDERREIPRYNTANHWKYEGRHIPEDYNAVGEAAAARHWMTSFLKPDCQQFTIPSADINKLLGWQRISHLVGPLSSGTLDDIKDLADKRSYQKLREALKIDSYFVRSDYTSLKRGKHKNKIYKSLAEVFESMVTSERSHSPLGPAPEGRKEALPLFLVPWRTIKPDLEFRVFVDQKKITAISQQDVYRKNGYLDEQKIPEIVQKLDAHFRDNIRDQITTLDSYVMDMALIGDSASTVYFIEINAFGKDYGSASAAFNWVDDANKLHVNNTGTIYFRYVV